MNFVKNRWFQVVAGVAVVAAVAFFYNASGSNEDVANNNAEATDVSTVNVNADVSTDNTNTESTSETDNTNTESVDAGVVVKKNEVDAGTNNTENAENTEQ